MNSHAVGILTGLLLLLLTTASSSQSAADWSRAAQATGCQMIVWEREQSECISRQSDAKVACERQDLSCADLKFDAILGERERAVRDLDRAKSDGKRDAIDQAERALSSIDSQIRGAKSEAARREDVNQRCAQLRRSVMQIFQQTSDRAAAQRSTSGSEPYANDMATNH